MKKYGIYLAYPPTVDLRAEGLGRHLAEFLKGANARGDIQFVIACPSWMVSSLEQLFEASEIKRGSFEIIAPAKQPTILALYQWYVAYKKRSTSHGNLRKIFKKFRVIGAAASNFVKRMFVGTRSPIVLSILMLLFLPLFLVGGVCAGLFLIGRAGQRWFQLALSILVRRQRVQGILETIHKQTSGLVTAPKNFTFVTSLYRLMENAEAQLLRALIMTRSDVPAWVTTSTNN